MFDALKDASTTHTAPRPTSPCAINIASERLGGVCRALGPLLATTGTEVAPSLRALIPLVLFSELKTQLAVCFRLCFLFCTSRDSNTGTDVFSPCQRLTPLATNYGPIQDDTAESLLTTMSRCVSLLLMQSEYLLVSACSTPAPAPHMGDLSCCVVFAFGVGTCRAACNHLAALSLRRQLYPNVLHVLLCEMGTRTDERRLLPATVRAHGRVWAVWSACRTHPKSMTTLKSHDNTSRERVRLLPSNRRFLPLVIIKYCTVEISLSLPYPAFLSKFAGIPCPGCVSYKEDRGRNCASNPHLDCPATVSSLLSRQDRSSHWHT